MAHDVSLVDARRIALAAQGFDRPRPTRAPRVDDLRRAIRRLGLLQLDFVNVLAPAHQLVLFSRLGPYATSRLHALVYGGDEFTEQWAHEASIVPMETWPLLRHRMATRRVRPYGFDKFLAARPDYVAWVLDEVRRRGPLGANDLPAPDGHDRRIEHAWVGTIPRAVLEAHLTRGAVAVVGRGPNFARTYELAERAIPPAHYTREITKEAAERALLQDAARALGIATSADLADYYRLPVTDARPRLAELVDTGSLRIVRVEGWREPAYLHPDASTRPVDVASLLSPFDPLVWHRPRTARLFEFDYSLEIYVPEAKRRWGYYVLPFLLGDRLVARVDLKANRKARTLQVLSSHRESHADAAIVAEALAIELRTLGRWLGLSTIAIEKRGNLARALAAAAGGGRSASGVLRQTP